MSRLRAVATTEPGSQATAIIYLRVSTRDQATRGGEAEGFSIPAQREACLRKAEALNATVVEEFTDAGGECPLRQPAWSAAPAPVRG